MSLTLCIVSPPTPQATKARSIIPAKPKGGLPTNSEFYLGETPVLFDDKTRLTHGQLLTRLRDNLEGKKDPAQSKAENWHCS